MQSKTFTIEEFPNVSRQDVFTQGAEHMSGVLGRLRGGQQCFYDCSYRYKDPLAGETSCVAGCFITDSQVEVINRAGAGRLTWRVLEKHKAVPELHSDLVAGLQRIYDHTIPNRWLIELRRFAKRKNLNCSV